MELVDFEAAVNHGSVGVLGQARHRINRRELCQPVHIRKLGRGENRGRALVDNMAHNSVLILGALNSHRAAVEPTALCLKWQDCFVEDNG